MALLPLRRKVRWGIFRPKNLTALAGLNLRTWVPKASTLPPDHRSCYTDCNSECIYDCYMFPFHCTWHMISMTIVSTDVCPQTGEADASTNLKTRSWWAWYRARHRAGDWTGCRTAQSAATTPPRLHQQTIIWYYWMLRYSGAAKQSLTRQRDLAWCAAYYSSPAWRSSCRTFFNSVFFFTCSYLIAGTVLPDLSHQGEILVQSIIVLLYITISFLMYSTLLHII